MNTSSRLTQRSTLNLNASKLLKDELDTVMQKWEDAVRSQLPSAREVSSESLQNSLPDFLSHVAEIISTTHMTVAGESSIQDVLRFASIHGTRRAEDHRFTLDQVIVEYQILRTVTLALLEEKLSLTRLEREKLLEMIDCGLVQAATEFTERRGFQASRLSEAEDQARNARGQLKKVQGQVDELQLERALRERFVSTLSHDLRTPLTAVRASSELIAKQAEKPEVVRRLAAKIYENSNRIDRMIRDLLDANRIEAGEPVPLKIEECDLAFLVKDLIEGLATVHGDRFSLHAGGNLKGFWSPHDLQRVVENLIGNGLKYGNPTDPVEVALSGHADSVTIAIHNRGKPIPREQQKDLFQPFKRLVSAQMSENGGWGLGLILAKGVVEAHGGKIDLDSRTGYGTTFTVSLPRDSRPS